MLTLDATTLAERGGHRFWALADLLEEAIADGRLSVGAKLPPQRDLAHRVGVTVGTVSRAYDLLQQRGLVAGEVGRGTFVTSGPRPTGVQGPLVDHSPLTGAVDLRLNRPNPHHFQELWAEAKQAIAAADPLDVFNYGPTSGRSAGRQDAAAWLERHQVIARPEHIILTNGCEGALHLALAALSRPGDSLMAAGLGYAHFQDLTRLLHLRPAPVPTDDEGILPEGVDRTAAETGAKLLLLNPNLHNPTGSVLSEDRRRALVDIAERHDLLVIEDDVYGLLLEKAPPPVAALLPNQTVFVTSISKTLAPGLRLGFLTAPPRFIGRLTDTQHSLSVCHPAFPTIAFGAWLKGGLADRVVTDQRAELAIRHRIAQDLLSRRANLGPVPSCHLWVELPPRWRAAALVERLAERNVHVVNGEHFVFGRGRSPNAIRVVVSGVADRDALAASLETIARTIDQEGSGSADVLV